MSDTLLGAFIAGIAGVVTAIIGGCVKWFLDVRAHGLRFSKKVFASR